MLIGKRVLAWVFEALNRKHCHGLDNSFQALPAAAEGLGILHFPRSADLLKYTSLAVSATRLTRVHYLMDFVSMHSNHSHRGPS